MKGYDFLSAYLYLWDRTRQIRAEMSYQQYRSVEAVGLYEEIARFHIAVEHRLCEDAEFQTNHRQQNWEQLNATLVSLREIYVDLAGRGIVCPNECEFQGYLLLMQRDGPILQLSMGLSTQVLISGPVQFALEAFRAQNDSNWVRFFNLVRSGTYLQACLMHARFPRIRAEALRRMASSIKGAYSLEKLVRVLGFEDADEASDFCEAMDLKVTSLEGQACVMFPNRPHSAVLEDVLMLVRKATIVIESKVDGILLRDVVTGRAKMMSSTKPGVALVDVDPSVLKAKLESGLSRSRSADVLMRRSNSKQVLAADGEEDIVVVVDDEEEAGQEEEAEVPVDDSHDNNNAPDQVPEEKNASPPKFPTSKRQSSPVVVFVPRIPESFGVGFTDNSSIWSMPAASASGLQVRSATPQKQQQQQHPFQFDWDGSQGPHPLNFVPAAPVAPLSAVNEQNIGVGVVSAATAAGARSPMEKVQTRLKKKVSSSRLKLARQREEERALRKAKRRQKRKEEEEMIERLMPARLESFSQSVPEEYLAKELVEQNENNDIEAALQGRFYLSRIWDQMRVEEEKR